MRVQSNTEMAVIGVFYHFVISFNQISIQIYIVQIGSGSKSQIVCGIEFNTVYLKCLVIPSAVLDGANLYIVSGLLDTNKVRRPFIPCGRGLCSPK